MTEAQILVVPVVQSPAVNWRERSYGGISVPQWGRIGVLSLLFYCVFWSNFARLWAKTNPFYGEPNWGHATIVPLIGLYFLYVNRDSLLAAPRKTSWVGLGIMLIGLILFAYGIFPGQNDFIKDFGMVTTLFGLVLHLCGWQVMKIAWFPIAFLVCAIPWPGTVYSWVAGPLQQLAANVAVNALELTGVKAYAGGTKIFIYGHDDLLRTLNVAEACAGLRSLMTFISVAAAVAFLSARPIWQRLLVVASAVPIAIFCNVMRVTGQGLLDHYVSQEWSENFAHKFVGMIMLMPAFLLILAVGWVLDQMFVEEAERRHELAHRVLRRTAPTAIIVRPPPPAAVLRRSNGNDKGNEEKGSANGNGNGNGKVNGRQFSPRGLPPRMEAARGSSPAPSGRQPPTEGKS